MGNVIKVSKAGLEAFKIGLDGVSLEAQLMMEIIVRVSEIDSEQLIDLAEELEERFGSTEEALLAIKWGLVGFEEEEVQ
jgi:hypothetical protein